MIFLDASALVAILTEEADAPQLLATLDAVDGRLTSPIAIYEAVLAVARKVPGTLDEARQDVEDLLRRLDVRVVAIEPSQGDLALAAFARYGKGRGHPAQLNMGDCFAYAVAVAHGAALLYTGNDFIHTDIRAAGRGA